MKKCACWHHLRFEIVFTKYGDIEVRVTPIINTFQPNFVLFLIFADTWLTIFVEIKRSSARTPVPAQLWSNPQRGGLLLEILGGGVPPGFSNPDPISDLKSNFPQPFLDQNSKINTPQFRPGLQEEITLSLFRLERKQKNCSNQEPVQIHFEYPYFSSFLLIWN